MKDIELWHGDCLEEMKKIADKSVDCVICDLPYGTTACKWDVIIPFDELWEQYNRVIKDNGAICLFGSEPFSSMLRMSNLKKYKYDWIWKKRPVNFLNAKKQPLREIENIIVFNTNKYNPQGLVECHKINKRSNSTETNRKHGLINVSEFTNYPRQILEFYGERGLHPTQKPVALIEYLIKTYSNEGDLILDNTAGSMTTAIAAINTDRRCICIEKDDHYFEVGSERVKKHLENRQLKLF